MLKAVIFDFDGVIADSELCHFAAFKEILAEFGIDLTKDKYYADYLGYTDVELLETIVEDFHTDFDGRAIADISAQKAKVFERVVTQSDKLIDGISEFVTLLKNNNIPIAINSGAIAADIEIILKGTDLENSFEIIVTADDVEKGKPDPEGYLLAVEKLAKKSGEEIAPAQCIAIEDSRWGIMSAKSAGLKVVAVTNTYSADQLERADLIVDSVRELTIENMQKFCI